MSGGMPPCLPVTEEVSAVHTRTRTHTHTHTHTHTPTHTDEILEGCMKEDTSTWCLFPRDMLGQCWRNVGFFTEAQTYT